MLYLSSFQVLILTNCLLFLRNTNSEVRSVSINERQWTSSFLLYFNLFNYTFSSFCAIELFLACIQFKMSNSKVCRNQSWQKIRENAEFNWHYHNYFLIKIYSPKNRTLISFHNNRISWMHYSKWIIQFLMIMK